MTHITPTTAAPTTERAATSRRGARVGAVLTALTAAFLAFDGVTHLLGPTPVVDAVAALGFAPGAALVMGVVLLVSVALHLVPRTSLLGAVLITGYLGGAVTAQLEAGLGTILFPVFFGVLVWAGLWLRDPQVRAVLPVRSARAADAARAA